MVDGHFGVNFLDAEAGCVGSTTLYDSDDSFCDSSGVCSMSHIMLTMLT